MIFALVVVVYFWIIKPIMRATKSPGEEELRQSLSADEKKFRKDGQELSYPESAYDNFADVIQQAGYAFSFDGVDQEAIYGVFEQMQNDLDTLYLIKAFGRRRVEMSMQSAALGGFLRTELDEEEMAKINDILAAKGIIYKF